MDQLLACLSVCLFIWLSVMLCIVGKQYVLWEKCLNKWIGSAPRIMILQITTINCLHQPLKLPPLEPQMLVPSGEYIKTYCDQANWRNFHVWILHGCSRQRRTIGWFWSTAGLLIHSSFQFIFAPVFVLYQTGDHDSKIEMYGRAMMMVMIVKSEPKGKKVRSNTCYSVIPALNLPSRSRYSFTNPKRMEGWVNPGPRCKEQLAHSCYRTARGPQDSNPDPAIVSRAR